MRRHVPGVFIRDIQGGAPGPMSDPWPGQESGVIFPRVLKRKLHVNAVTDTIGRFMRWRYLNATQCTLNARTASTPQQTGTIQCEVPHIVYE